MSKCLVCFASLGVNYKNLCRDCGKSWMDYAWQHDRSEDSAIAWAAERVRALSAPKPKDPSCRYCGDYDDLDCHHEAPVVPLAVGPANPAHLLMSMEDLLAIVEGSKDPPPPTPALVALFAKQPCKECVRLEGLGLGPMCWGCMIRAQDAHKT